jgi:UDP-N-acetyl-D-glucosamine dehydrogenase
VKIAVIGQGYVGLPLAKAAANAGHTVIGFDNNEAVIKQLLSSEVTTSNYTPTLDPKTITGCDIYIIAVPTPLDSDNKPDLSYLKSAAKQVGEVAKDGALIINESTSYPGTLREVVEATISSINKSKLLYAAAPERIDPANTKWSIKNTPRVVAGLSDEATTATLNFYKSFCDQVVAVSSAEVAEAAKLFENTFRQVNIALVNEFAQIAEKFGISANEVIDAAATKPFGFMKFTPGLGVGGHCIPIDPIYLEQKAESLGATASFIKQATAVNQKMPLYVVQRLEKILGNNLKGKRICIVGLSYKKDVADLRQSPSIALWKELERRGSVVSFHDEIVKTFDNVKSIALDKSSFDLAVIGVRHSDLDLQKLKASATYLFDCTGTIPGVETL